MMRDRIFVSAVLAMGLFGIGCRDNSGRVGSSTGGSGGSSDGGGGQTGGTGGSGTGGQGTGGAGMSGDSGSGTGGDASIGSETGPAPQPVPITCDGVANPQCNDGTDNDNDGLIDSADGECVAPCDNDEASFATGIPGDNMDACKQDCFFDGNSGQGDDGCNWDLRCDSANPGGGPGGSCPYEAGRTCRSQQSDKCVRNCRKLTPNGCDCFGCCSVTYGTERANLLLVSGCTADKFGNPTICPRCTQNTACLNTCETCEVCVGKPAPDPSCTSSGGTDGGTSGTDAGSSTDAPEPQPSQCSSGVQSCGPGGQVAASGCATGTYCQTGCCLPYVID